MTQKGGLCLCACVSKREQAMEEKEEREGDLTSALLEMGFFWMGELGEGWKHIKSHFQFVAGS